MRNIHETPLFNLDMALTDPTLETLRVELGVRG
jgi:hypothetical protein